jgi:hypothetical protein
MEKTRGRPQITGKKLSLPASPVGEQTGGEKLAVLLSPWQPLVKLFSPMSEFIQLKSGLGMTDITKKVEPRTGNQIILRSRATGKKIFTSIRRKF